MPPSMREWLPAEHLCYFVSDTIDEMDLSEIEIVYEKDLRGQPPYHPGMMTKVLFYAYCTGVFSSRRIAKKLEDDVAVFPTNDYVLLEISHKAGKINISKIAATVRDLVRTDRRMVAIRGSLPSRRIWISSAALRP